MVDFKKLLPPEPPIRESIQALIDRGHISSRETSTIACQSREWQAMYPHLTDEALLATVQHNLNNCSTQRSKERLSTYEDVLVAVLVPELLARLEAMEKRRVEIAKGMIDTLAREEGVKLFFPILFTARLGWSEREVLDTFVALEALEVVEVIARVCCMEGHVVWKGPRRELLTGAVPKRCRDCWAHEEQEFTDDDLMEMSVTYYAKLIPTR